MRGGPREGFGGAQPGAGRKPDAEPKKPRAVRLSDRQAAAFQSLGGVGWLQGQCNLEADRLDRLSAAKPPAAAHAWPDSPDTA